MARSAIGELAAPHRMPLAAASTHVKVLERAGLLQRTVQGRTPIRVRDGVDGCELVLIHELDPKWADYATRTRAGWTVMLEALARYLSATIEGAAP